MDKHFIWFTKGDLILKHKRNAKNGTIFKNFIHKLITPNEDICRFLVTNDFVISGGRKGSIAVWDKSSAKQLFYGRNLHSNDINSVDFYRKDLVISGSKDQSVKIWSLKGFNSNRNCFLSLKNTIEINDRVWSVSTNDFQGSVLVGSAACAQRKPLLMYDIET